MKKTERKEKKLKWNLSGFCDSDYAGDTDTRQSISGYIIYVNNCPMSWRSQGQKSVTLSSTEAEYVAILEIVVEILFLQSIFEFIGQKIETPIVVNVDNVGAIYLAKKATTSNRTKHMDICYHFVQEYIEKGEVLIQFVRLKMNNSDIMTKNLNEENYWKHKSKMING